MVRVRKNGNNLRNDQHDTIYHKLNYKILQAFAIHKAIGKQASKTKILHTGIFGIFPKH